MRLSIPPGSSVFTFLCCLFWTACTAQEPVPAPKVARRETAAYYGQLNSVATFRALQGEPLSAKFNDVQSVKVVYELRGGKLYFVNSARYRYHYNFCQEALGDASGLAEFNADNYGSTRRRNYCLANLNYYTQSGIYALEFVSDDQINAALLQEFYSALQLKTYLKDSLRLLVGTDYLRALDTAGKLTMRRVYPSDIYAGQQYQQLNAGMAYGTLHLIPDLGSNYRSVDPQDIIVVKGTPLNVPVCAGIITNTFQTPLSHINILCHSRDIPSAAWQSCWNNAQLKALNGKTVKMVVTKDSVHIEPATAAEVASIARLRAARKPVVLKYDLRATHLLPASDMGMKQANTIGNKAAGLGELYRLSKKNNSHFFTPEGAFAIPFYCYQQHISNPAIKSAIDVLLNMPQTDKDAVATQLKVVRKAIKAEPLDAGLLADVTRQIRSANAGNSYRFRSSSNAEDKSGFSGAGLYESKTGILGDSVKSIERAIKAVWASAWNDEPYNERDFYHIDQRSAMMGILCHRNFPDEASNGVAITRNLYRYGFPGFTVNVQQGEVSVVSPPDSVTCEQFICVDANEINPENNDITTDYITYSNINKGKPVLSRAQITRLYCALHDVKAGFYWSSLRNSQEDFTNYALDIEFKFDQNGKLYLKQVRPY